MAEITLEEAPASARPLYEKGMAALERDNLDYAMDMFTAALSVEPRLLRIRSLLRTAALRKAGMKPPGKLLTLKKSGTLIKIASLSKKNPFQALELAEKTLNTDPLNTAFSKAHCSAAMAAGLPEVAIQTLEFLKTHQAADLPALQLLADLYQQASQFEQEFASREKIAELSPNDTMALKHLKDAAARLTMDKGDWKNPSAE